MEGGKVVGLKLAETQDPRPVPELIELLEGMLLKAKSGALQQACIIATIDNDTSLAFAGIRLHHDIIHYIGMLELGKIELAHQVLSDQE